MKRLVFASLASALLASTAPGAFHFMQIEEVIGGVNGNTNAQAIQLRMRSAGQNQVQSSKIWAADANGQNRILLLDITTAVTNSAAGSRILLVTSAFTAAMLAGGATTFTADFTLTTAIPASYLAAGKITFEDNAGTTTTPGGIYWSIAWGGASYTGTNLGFSTAEGGNDNDGNFGPAFGSALPTSSRQGIIFTGAASATSTSNSAQYSLTANPATVTKNNGTAFSVVPEPGSAALLAAGALFLGGFSFARRRRS